MKNKISNWTLNRPPPQPPNLEFLSGELDNSKKILQNYPYWVSVQGGKFSERIERLKKIELWLEENKIDYYPGLNRYYFSNQMDVTMLLLRWS